MTASFKLKSSSLTYIGLFFLAALIVLAIWYKPINLILPTTVQDAATIFLGITIEALPFIVLGSIVAALIRRFISTDRLLRWTPSQPILAFPFASLLGMLFPICECGNMPVARSLVRQGLKPAYAITFLLAAPILNPAVIITTVAAFRGSIELIWARFIVGAIVAIAVGIFFYRYGDRGVLRQAEEEQYLDPEHCHLNEHTSLIGEFIEMFGALTLGAAIAAILQAVVPYQVLSTLSSSPEIAILAMMALAFIISICSTVDAFFALAYASIFPSSAILGFLVFGPMVDIKAISLMNRTWKPKTIAIICLLAAQLVFIISLGLHYTNIL